MKFKFSGLTLLALHLIQFVLLLWVYTTYVVVNYAYLGVFFDSLNIKKAMFSMLFIIAGFALLRNNETLSFFYLNMIIAFTVTPSLVIYSGSDLPFSFAVITWFAFVIVAFVAQISKLRRIHVKQHIKPKTLLGWLTVFSLLLLASIFALGGGKFINFDFSLVYDFRLAAHDNLPYIYGYLIPTFSNAIIPIGIVLSLRYRQRVPLLVLFFCAIMIFVLSSHKTPLFVPFVIILVYWFSKYPKRENIVLLALIVGVVMSGVVYYYLKQFGIEGIWKWIPALIIYRMLLLPCLINWHHIDFFSTNPYYYWAESKFSLGLITNPYDLSMPFLVSREYFGIERMGSANTGWIGSGMGNTGILGIVLYSVLIGLLLSLIDAYAKKLDKSIVFAIFLVPVMNMIQSIDLTTMLLSHGLIVLLLFVVLLEPDVKQRAFNGKGNL